MRDISTITPYRTKNPAESGYDMNTHVIKYTVPFDQSAIEKMVGFRKLLQTCSQNDIKIQAELIEGKSLKLHFEPAAAFSKSVVFGARYTNVRPIGFTHKNMVMRPH